MRRYRCYKLVAVIYIFILCSGVLAGCKKVVDNSEPIQPVFVWGEVTSSVDASEASINSFDVEEIVFDNDLDCEFLCWTFNGSRFVTVSRSFISDDDIDNCIEYQVYNTDGVLINKVGLQLADDSLFVSDDVLSLIEIENETRVQNDYWIQNDGKEATYGCDYSFSNFYMLQDESTIGLVSYLYSADADYYGSYIYEYKYILTHWDINGEVDWYKQLLASDNSADFFISKSFLLNDNVLLFAECSDSVDVIKCDGYGNESVLNNISVNSELLNINNIIELNKKYIAFIKNDKNENEAYYFDLDNLCLGEKINLPDYIVMNGYRYVSGLNDDTILFSDYIGVYSYCISDNYFGEYMNYVNSGFEGGFVQDLRIINKDSFYCKYYSIDDFSEKYAVITRDKSIDERAIVVLGAHNLPITTREEIIKYNNSNEVYRILVKDYVYSDSLGDSDYGYRLLEDDIMNGVGPDFLVVDPGKLNVSSLSMNGKLISWQYLVNLDNQLDSSDFCVSVIDAYAINGNDCIMVYDFRYSTFLGNSDIVGNENFWTVDDFKKILKKAPSKNGAMYKYETQNDCLEKIIKYNAVEYIDYGNRSTNFNCKDFVSLLEYADSLPPDIDTNREIYNDDSAYRVGDILILEENIVTISNYWKDSYRYFDGKATTVGFPSGKKTSAVVEFIDFPFMIAAERNINGAWDFVKRFYSPQYQMTIENAIPIHEYALGVWGQNAISSSVRSGVNELGETYYYYDTYYYDGYDHEIPSLTENDIETIIKMFSGVNKAAIADDAIENIIREEANSYFTGNQTVNQAANNIDERVSLYLYQ